MTMAMTVETPPPDRIRPAAVAGLLLGDLIAPAAIYYAARALGAPVVLALILGGLAYLPRQVAAVELLLAVSLPLNAAAAVPVIAVPVLLGGTALYGQRTGLGIRRSLEAMSQQATGGAR
jgi:hypothetical protein